ncbi:MAG TPA: acetyl-CoA C-acyltransferase [Acidimicrobiales bacterium]|nr:acetyl-CoA C-acyltransferase [Acidimicrobiales bacterium]
MGEVVIIDAVRSAVGKRNGGLSRKYATELLGDVLAGLLSRNPLDPRIVDEVVGGCVNQLGMQASNVIRNSWLGADLPLNVPAATINTQCGSSQEATRLAQGLIAGGLAEVVVSCGVESMSQVPMGSTAPSDPDYGQPRGGRYAEVYEPTTQFEGAERIAETWGLERAELEVFAKASQDRAARAWNEGRFDGQIIPVSAPAVDDTGAVVGNKVVDRDEGMRETTLDGLANLKPNLRDRSPAFHTAGTSSQISDGAGALLLMEAGRAEQLGLRPRARIVESVLVGSDPVLMLTGPIPATRKLLERSGLSIDDIDLFEVNEAFAAVVLAWQEELRPDPEKVNVNGGAIALGHPLGGTGTILLTKVLHELERTGGRYGLVTMCCGGGLGTGTIVERL